MSQAIAVENVSKWFRRYHSNRPMTLQEAVLRGLRRLGPAEQFYALHDISFTVPTGTMLGILGHNGAGKSTLLRLIGKVGRPDTGTITVHGHIGALLDLGAGFHPDLTGRENLFINGIISGLTRREVAQRFDSIVAFAELEQFIDSPLRTYSSGMQMRLAFAIAAHIEADVLLIDEVLAVGDAAFQQKCLKRIARFAEEGRTVVLVSHDASLVRKLCDRVLWLRRGELVAHGEVDVVVGQYLAEMLSETQRRTPSHHPHLRTTSGRELRVNQNRFGSLEMEIRRVCLQDNRGNLVTHIDSGDPLWVRIDYCGASSVASPILGVTITREDGFVCYDTSTQVADVQPGSVDRCGQISLHLERLDLAQGIYYVDVGIYHHDWADAYDYHWQVYPLEIRANGGGKGILHPPHRWVVTPRLPPSER